MKIKKQLNHTNTEECENTTAVQEAIHNAFITSNAILIQIPRKGGEPTLDEILDFIQKLKPFA